MNRRTDIVSGIVLAAAALAVLLWMIPANTSPPQSANNLSPAFLPSVATALMLVLAVLLFLTSWFDGSGGSDQPHEEFGSEARGIGWRELGDLATWSLFAVVLMVGFIHAGFLPTAVPALALAMLYAGERNWLLIASVAIAVPVLIQQVAWHAFTVQLP